MKNTLLPRDPTYKQQVGYVRANPVFSKDPGTGGALIFAQINAVMDNVDLLFGNVEQSYNVSFGIGGNRDNRVCKGKRRSTTDFLFLV